MNKTLLKRVVNIFCVEVERAVCGPHVPPPRMYALQLSPGSSLHC